MNDRLRHIAILLFLPVFLFSATGFSLVKHSCGECGLVEYSLHDPGNCCQENDHDFHNQFPEISCCYPNQDFSFGCEAACCELESQFLKTSETLNPHHQKGLVITGETLPPHISFNDLLVQNQSGAIHSYKYFHSTRLSGKLLLFAIQQLKLDCHQA